MALQHSGKNSGTDQYNFGKETPEKQREISQKNSPAENVAAENEKLPRENAEKYQQEQSRHTH